MASEDALAGIVESTECWNRPFLAIRMCRSHFCLSAICVTALSLSNEIRVPLFVAQHISRLNACSTQRLRGHCQPRHQYRNDHAQQEWLDG